MKMKKLLALILVLVLSLSLIAACGKKDKDKDDDDDEDGKKTTQEAAETIADAFKQAGEIKEGEFEVSLVADLSATGAGKADIKLFGEGNKKDCKLGFSVALKINDVDVDMSIDEAIIVADGNLYVNLGGFLELADEVADGVASSTLSQAGLTEDLKWFMIPLPDEITELSTTDLAKNTQEAYKKLVEDLVAVGKQDGTKVTFDNKDQILSVIEVFAAFVESNYDSIMESATNSSDTVDLNAYAEKLINCYKDDVIEVAAAMGLTEDMVNTYIDQIKAMDLNDTVQQYVEKSEEMAGDTPDAAELASQIRAAKDSIGDEMKGSLVVEATCKDGVFEVSAVIESTDEENKGNVTLTSKLTDKKVSISAPSDLTTLSDFAPLLTALMTSYMSSQY